MSRASPSTLSFYGTLPLSTVLCPVSWGSDLTFIEEDATYVDQVNINFEKMTLLSQSHPFPRIPLASPTVFERLQDFRLQLYDIEEDQSIQLFLHNKVVKSQAELDALAEATVTDADSFGDPHV